LIDWGEMPILAIFQQYHVNFLEEPLN